MDIINKGGPSITPCGTHICNQELKTESIFKPGELIPRWR